MCNAGIIVEFLFSSILDTDLDLIAAMPQCTTLYIVKCKVYTDTNTNKDENTNTITNKNTNLIKNSRHRSGPDCGNAAVHYTVIQENTDTDTNTNTHTIANTNRK